MTFSEKLQLVKQLYQSFQKTVWGQLVNYPQPDLYYHLLLSAISPMEEDMLRHQLTHTSHQRDLRRLTDYAREILLNWLMEDLIIEQVLFQYFRRIKRIGSDRNREFLTGPKVAADPDILADGRRYDMKFDWTGYWTAKGVVDLRDGEYPLLIRQEAGLILITPAARKLAILYNLEDLKVTRGRRHHKWNKPYYALKIPRKMSWLAW
ncbi:MAG: hypothetical protein K9N11_08990 [Lentisphaeria bacterium]|nr:hypothetical protein [Candidatus Neomarinimicrobiota bacterium]MCF7842973.1 hypothetical protein [Lentisphaeria bacterium]